LLTRVNTRSLKPLPVERAPNLVAVYTVDAKNKNAFSNLLQNSFPNYLDYRDRNDVFSGLAAYSFSLQRAITADGVSEQIFAEMVTGNYFEVLGVRAATGRFFRADDDRVRGGAPVIVLSYKLWQRRFGGSPDVVGRTVTVNGLPFTVLGVTIEPFHGVNSLF